jgi:hypothetical protein
MRDAGGIILGSPVYFSDIKPMLKALIARSGRVGRTELTSYLLGIGAQIPDAEDRRTGSVGRFRKSRRPSASSALARAGRSYQAKYRFDPQFVDQRLQGPHLATNPDERRGVSISTAFHHQPYLPKPIQS